MWEIFGRIEPNGPERLRFSFKSKEQAEACLALLQTWRLQGPKGNVSYASTTYGTLENPRTREEEKENRR